MRRLTLTAVPHIPLIQPGDDLAQILAEALLAADLRPQAGDVLAIAQKIVSKAEGRYVNLKDVVPSDEAVKVAHVVDKDARLVELILQESTEISRMAKGVLIVRHKLGFTSANAGIDRSNIKHHEGEEQVLLLPQNPDRSAAALRTALHNLLGIKLGLIITDSHGRPFRLGIQNIAIGVAGIPALVDKRGDLDMFGNELKVTTIGLADELAAASGLLMGQADEAAPAVLMQGLNLPESDGQAHDLVRPREIDLYYQ